MANIILAWEYERDTAQIDRLKQLYYKLRAMGHQVFMVGPELTVMDTDIDILFLSAPRAPVTSLHQPHSVIKIGGFSDRLALLGFKDANTLRNLTKAWDTLFQLLQPHLIICDCAPVASLAAYKNIATIQMSDGISLPPYHLTDFPRLRPDAVPLASSREMLKNVCIVQTQRNKCIPPSLPAILESDYTFITNMPELDPYFNFRSGTSAVIGPYSALPEYSIHHQRDHFFACLDLNYPDIEETVIGLTELDKKGIFYLHGASFSLQQYIQQMGHIISAAFPSMREVMAKSAFVIHHGNITLAEAALAAGLPQFNLPANFENDWISQNLVNLRVCVTIYPEFDPISKPAKDIRTVLEIKQGCKNHHILEWAALQAQHVKDKNYVPLENAVISACERLLA